MTAQIALAAAAALVAMAMALSTFERWLARRRRHELAWSVALAMFTAGSAALWLGAGLGWTAATFRVFYLFGAITNVPVLALGTVYLLSGHRRGDVSAAAVALFCAFSAGVLAVAPLTQAVPVDRLPRGSEVFGPLPRVLAAVASSVGALVIVAGAGWSAWRFRRDRGRRGLVAGNLLIAAGTLVLGAGGVLNSVLDEMEAFAVSLVAGITLIFIGFLVATPPVRPRPGPASLPSPAGPGSLGS